MHTNSTCLVRHPCYKANKVFLRSSDISPWKTSIRNRRLSIQKIHLKGKAYFKQGTGVNFPCHPLFSGVYWGVQPSCHQEKKAPHAHDVGKDSSSACSQAALAEFLSCLDKRAWSARRDLDTLKAVAHRDTWAPCSSSELESLCTGEKILNCTREQEKVYPKDKIRGMSPIYQFTSVLLFSCCYGNTKESSDHCVFKGPVKSRCEQYHLFAACNFLIQAVLNSFVWGEGMNNIPFSIHMLKLANLLPALENIQKIYSNGKHQLIRVKQIFFHIIKINTLTGILFIEQMLSCILWWSHLQN